MRLSLQVQYAICAVFDLAYNGVGEPMQGRVISARQAIPARFLEQIFRRLRRAELVDGKRGPGGGYTLARAPGEITLRGKTEEISFEMVKTGEGESERFGKKIGFEAKFNLQRTKFGIDYATPGVGDEVGVTVSIEANHTDGHDHSED